MSDEVENEQEITPAEGVDVGPSMAAGSGPDLESKALDAAAAAITRAERALRETRRSAHDLEPVVARRGTGRRWGLRAILAINMLLMVVMLALPNPPFTGQETPPSGGTTGARGPIVNKAPGSQGHATIDEESAHPVGPQPLDLPREEVLLAASELYRQGRLGDAISELQRHLRAHPNLRGMEQKVIWGQLAMYLAMDGRLEEAEHYLEKSRGVLSSSYMPQDMLEMARQAEEEGRGARMRQLYARFLLTQKHHPTYLRSFASEAYLKLGDSFRIEADSGEKRAGLVQRAREEDLRNKTRVRRNARRQEEGK